MNLIGPSLSESDDLPRAYGGCSCHCHRTPNVYHVMACCGVGGRGASLTDIHPNQGQREIEDVNPAYLLWFDLQVCTRCGYTTRDCTCPGACIDRTGAPKMYLGGTQNEK